MAKLRKDLAWLVQVIDEYGTRKIRATVVIPQPDGSMNSIDALWRFNNDAKDFADLHVTCYLGELDFPSTGDRDKGSIWGLRHEFVPARIDDVRHAQDIARMLGKIKTGLDKANAEMGYQQDADFVGYLGRIGAAIGVSTFYVRNSTPFRDMTGEKWRKVDGGNLQYWLREVSKLARTEPGTLAQMTRGAF